jgi:hypothetical protein
VDTTEQRGVAQVTSTLPSSLTVTLPPPYTAPTLSVNTSGAIQLTAQDFSYGESPAIGYQMSVSASSGARYEYFITAGWLGNANAYTTPVLETLAGWNSAWNLQRGESADVALRVYVSPSGATLQAVWSYLQGNPAPSGFILRYATRRQTLATPELTLRFGEHPILTNQSRVSAAPDRVIVRFTSEDSRKACESSGFTSYRYNSSVGPVAQRQSGRLITAWSQVRILPGPPAKPKAGVCVSVQYSSRRARA